MGIVCSRSWIAVALVGWAGVCGASAQHASAMHHGHVDSVQSVGAPARGYDPGPVRCETGETPFLFDQCSSGRVEAGRAVPPLEAVGLLGRTEIVGSDASVLRSSDSR